MSESLKHEILLTLSFFEPMTLEKIFLEIDRDYVIANPELKTEDLIKTLKKLERSKKVKKIMKNQEHTWTKNYPKRPWWKNFRFKF